LPSAARLDTALRATRRAVYRGKRLLKILKADMKKCHLFIDRINIFERKARK
jgi:hypothetical protein